MKLFNNFCFFLSLMVGLGDKLDAHEGNYSNSNIPISERLNIDGSMKTDAGFTGSLDITGYEMSYDLQTKEPKFFAKGKHPEARSIAWSALGSGVSSSVNAVAVSGSDVYVGGYFTTAGGGFASRIAKWNGSNWSALGSGVNNTVWAIAVSGSDIYVGGEFTSAGGNSASRIAKWDGSNWSALGNGVNNNVWVIAVSGSDIYAGGDFTTAGGNSANYIAKWNGSWSALGSGVNSRVCAIDVSGSNVYAGGWFNQAGGSSANRIAKWNGSSWSKLGLGLNNFVYAIAVSGSDVYVGGEFTTAGGSSTTANRIAKWNGSAWSALGSGMSYIVYSIVVSGSDVYAGGDFSYAGGILSNCIAKWNGSSWSAIGGGTNQPIRSLAVNASEGKMMVGGGFTTAGGSSAYYVASFTDSENSLPVELTSFTANIINNKVSLNWNTATEKDNHGFEIQRAVVSGQRTANASSDNWTLNAESWTKIGFVNGHGNSNSPIDYSFTDNKVTSAGKYCYRLKQIDSDGSYEYSGIVEVDFGQPNKFELMQNYPNPFNPSTKISYTVPQDSKVRLTLFNTLGQEIAVLEEGFKEAGFYNCQLSIDNYQLNSGVYFYRLETGSFVQVKKMIITK